MDIFKKFSKLDKYSKFAILIIIIGSILRLIYTGFSEVAGDAGWHMSVARYIAENGRIPLFEHIGRDVFWPPPLFHLLTAFLFKISFGLTWITKLVSPISGIFYLIISYITIKKYLKPRATMYSILFLSFIPAHFFFSTISYVDMLMGVLTITSIYYFLEKKEFQGSVFFGFAMLTKYNSAFLGPVLIYIIYLNYKSVKITLEKSFLLGGVSFSIAGWWYIRNWIYLGNPIWQFFNSFFKGLPIGSHYANKTSLANLHHLPQKLYQFLLSLFGVPQGNLSNFNFLPFGNFNSLLITIWVVAISIFFVFLIYGMFNRKNRIFDKSMFALIIFYVIEQLILIIELDNFHARKMMPAFIAFAYFWGLGFYKFIETLKFGQIRWKLLSKNIFITFVLLMSLSFLVTEGLKSYLSTKYWLIIDDDVSWVKTNTQPDALFLTPGGGVWSYKFDRDTLYPSTEYTASVRVLITPEYVLNNIDYVYYTKDHPIFGTLPMVNGIEDVIMDKPVVFKNDNTGVKIIKIGDYETFYVP